MGRGKAAPIKANIDMWSYSARQEFLRGNFTGATLLYQVSMGMIDKAFVRVYASVSTMLAPFTASVSSSMLFS